MAQWKRYSQKLLTSLNLMGVISSLFRQKDFPDEPPMFRYLLYLNNIKKLTDGDNWEGSASGYSFSSSEYALFKCLMEAAERLCNVSYKQNLVKYGTFNSLKTTDAIDPVLFGYKSEIRERQIGWIKGFELGNKKKKCLIPAQCIYFNFHKKSHEPLLTQKISTGAAGGLNFEETILRAIYEVIERDCFMTIYLNKISAPKLDLNLLKNGKIQKIIKKAEKYNLEVNVFNITNDLEIPSFLTILVDRTGLGPSITLGLKSSLVIENAILGSIEESFHVRPWLRTEMLRRYKDKFKKEHQLIDSILNRGMFWTSPKMIKKLDFLLNQKPVNSKLTSTKLTVKDELMVVTNQLLTRGINIYFADISIKRLKLLGFHFYKAIIPKLQPLYLNEKLPEIRKDRIKKVAEYFKIKETLTNPIPHPFL